MKLARGVWAGLAVAIIVVVADQITKLALRRLFNIYEPSAELRVPPVHHFIPTIELVMTWNHGVSFGVGNTSGVWNALLFTVLAVVISVAMLWWMAKSKTAIARLALGLLIGGAIGNIIDRIVYGAVEDFIYFHVASFDWWPIFNIADVAICVGAGLLVIDGLFPQRDSPMNRA